MTTAPTRRWFRWSLRTLFVVVAMAGIFTAWVQANRSWVRERVDILNHLERLNAMVAPCCNAADERKHPIPFVWRLFGAEPMQYIAFEGDGMPEAECQRIKDHFPEANVEWRNVKIWTTIDQCTRFTAVVRLAGQQHSVKTVPDLP